MTSHAGPIPTVSTCPSNAGVTSWMGTQPAADTATGQGILAGQFPANWSDKQIAGIIVDVARQPSHARWQRHGRWRFEGTRHGVTVVVIVEPGGEIRTAFPIAGSGVTFNPKEDTR